jgi:membrane associated rhomboid family serine protease
MFPIGDDNSDRTITPVVNYAFIGVNILVFLLLQQLGSNEAFDNAFALVPKEITTGVDITGVQVLRDSAGQSAQIRHYADAASGLPLISSASMFMHGGIAHIFGNMLFLWIFGDNLRKCARARSLRESSIWFADSPRLRLRS